MMYKGEFGRKPRDSKAEAHFRIDDMGPFLYAELTIWVLFVRFFFLKICERINDQLT
jgi:hypothetical protein